MAIEPPAADRRSLYLVQSNPVAGREDEFNDWYTRRHLPDIMTVPGFASAQRFVASPVLRRPGLPPYRYSYLAIYEITGDPRLAFDALAHAREAGMATSTAVAADYAAYLFDPITFRMLPRPAPG
jgi:hypothetical protein